MCAANGFYTCFGMTEVFHFALLDQFFYGAGHIFDWHLRVNTVLVEKIDYLGPEPLERSLCNLFDMLGTAVEARLLARVGREQDPADVVDAARAMGAATSTSSRLISSGGIFIPRFAASDAGSRIWGIGLPGNT